jgi:hypothetical protein
METHGEIQEKIFQILEPIIIECVQNLNQQFKVSKNNTLRDVKIVGVGGYALNQYLNHPVPTHDLDARIIFTDQDKINDVVNNDTETLKMLYIFKNIAMNSFVSTMNNIIEQRPELITQIIDETGVELVKVKLENGEGKYFFQQLMKMEKQQNISECIPENFKHVDTVLTENVNLALFNNENYCSYKLSSCMFVYELIGGNQIASSIFDLVPGCNHDKPTFNYNYKYSNLSSDDIALIQKWYKSDNFQTFTNTRETYGYIPNLLSLENSNEIKDDFYIAGLGYVIWDTIYMINLCLDYLSKSQDFKNDLVMLKFNRYVSKYIELLRALDNPKIHMSCKSFSEFVESCRDKK